MVCGLSRRAAGEPVPRARRDDHPRRHHVGLRRRKLLPHIPRDPRPDGGLPAARRARLRVRAASGDGNGLRRRHRQHVLRRLDRAALRGRDHGRLPRRKPADVLPDRVRHPRPDGDVPPEDLPRHGLRAARRKRRLLGRSGLDAPGALDRRNGAARDHVGLRPGHVLPEQSGDARADGGVSREDLPPPRGHPLPAAGDLGAEGRGDLGPARRREPLLARVAVQRRAFAVPRAAARARRRARRVRRLLPPGQLLDAPPAHAVLPQRPLPGRPAAPAHALRPAQDQRRLDQHDHPAQPGGAIHQHPQPERVRELPRHSRGHHAQPRDGRVPEHVDQHQDQPQRELRPRDHAAVLDRDRPPQPGRHDPEQRSDRLPARQLRPVGRRQPEARPDRLVHPAGRGHAQRRDRQRRQLPRPDAGPPQRRGHRGPAHARPRRTSSSGSSRTRTARDRRP